MQRKKASTLLTKGRGLSRRPLPLDPIPAQTGLASQSNLQNLTSTTVGHRTILLGGATEYREFSTGVDTYADDDTPRHKSIEK